jgi:hypothetical protein
LARVAPTSPVTKISPTVSQAPMISASLSRRIISTAGMRVNTKKSFHMV